MQYVHSAYDRFTFAAGIYVHIEVHRVLQWCHKYLGRSEFYLYSSRENNRKKMHIADKFYVLFIFLLSTQKGNRLCIIHLQTTHSFVCMYVCINS